MKYYIEKTPNGFFIHANKDSVYKCKYYKLNHNENTEKEAVEEISKEFLNEDRRPT